MAPQPLLITFSFLAAVSGEFKPAVTACIADIGSCANVVYAAGASDVCFEVSFTAE